MQLIGNFIRILIKQTLKADSIFRNVTIKIPHTVNTHPLGGCPKTNQKKASTITH